MTIGRIPTGGFSQVAVNASRPIGSIGRLFSLLFSWRKLRVIIAILIIVVNVGNSLKVANETDDWGQVAIDFNNKILSVEHNIMNSVDIMSNPETGWWDYLKSLAIVFSGAYTYYIFWIIIYAMLYAAVLNQTNQPVIIFLLIFVPIMWIMQIFANVVRLTNVGDPVTYDSIFFLSAMPLYSLYYIFTHIFQILPNPDNIPFGQLIFNNDNVLPLTTDNVTQTIDTVNNVVTVSLS